MRACTSGSLSAWLSSRFRRSTTGRGVPAVTNRPYQVDTSAPLDALLGQRRHVGQFRRAPWRADGQRAELAGAGSGPSPTRCCRTSCSTCAADDVDVRLRAAAGRARGSPWCRWPGRRPRRRRAACCRCPTTRTCRAPGLARIAASSSFTLLVRASRRTTTSTLGITATRPTGCRSLSGSNLSLSRCGATAWPVLVASSRVLPSGARARRDLGRDGVRRAGPVLHHHRLLESRRELVGQHPRQDVGAAAGRGADHDLDRLVRVRRLGSRGHGHGRQAGSEADGDRDSDEGMAHGCLRGMHLWRGA